MISRIVLTLAVAAFVSVGFLPIVVLLDRHIDQQQLLAFAVACCGLGWLGVCSLIVESIARGRPRGGSGRG